MTLRQSTKMRAIAGLVAAWMSSFPAPALSLWCDVVLNVITNVMWCVFSAEFSDHHALCLELAPLKRGAKGPHMSYHWHIWPCQWPTLIYSLAFLCLQVTRGLLYRDGLLKALLWNPMVKLIWIDDPVGFLRMCCKSEPLSSQIRICSTKDLALHYIQCWL